MARKRLLSTEELQQAVVDIINEAGGSIDHNALVEKLEASEYKAAATQLIAFKQARVIAASLTIENGRGVVTYTLPSGANVPNEGGQ